MSAERDPRVPRRYGPLIKLGMSLKEIRRHNEYEILTMLKAIERTQIIESGAQINAMTSEQRSKLVREKPEVAELLSYYRGEMFLVEQEEKNRRKKYGDRFGEMEQ